MNAIHTIKQVCYLSILCFLFIAHSSNAQKYIRSESNITIDASPQEVYDVIRSLEQFKYWSPFIVEDPNQINYIEGTDGEIGSIFHWEGVDEKSLGSQELTQLIGNEYVRLECDIKKPFKGQPLFEYHLTQTDQGTEVTQKFEVAMKGFSSFMARLFGTKRSIGKTNRLGLARLKEYIETQQVTTLSLDQK